MFARAGKVTQIAYVVNALDEAILHWNKLGVGPFFVLRDIEYVEQTYRGHSTDCRVSAAFAYFGDLQIELLQQLNDEPSTFKEFRDAQGTGVQHIGVVTEHITAATQALLAKGYTIVQRMVSKAGVETVLFDTGMEGTSVIELIQGGAALRDAFLQMKQAADAWDASQPGAIEIHP